MFPKSNDLDAPRVAQWEDGELEGDEPLPKELEQSQSVSRVLQVIL